MCPFRVSSLALSAAGPKRDKEGGRIGCMCWSLFCLDPTAMNRGALRRSPCLLLLRTGADGAHKEGQHPGVEGQPGGRARGQRGVRGEKWKQLRALYLTPRVCCAARLCVLHVKTPVVDACCSAFPGLCAGRGAPEDARDARRLLRALQRRARLRCHAPPFHLLLICCGPPVAIASLADRDLCLAALRVCFAAGPGAAAREGRLQVAHPAGGVRGVQGGNSPRQRQCCALLFSAGCSDPPLPYGRGESGCQPRHLWGR